VLNRIDVQNDPVNWIDPYGLTGLEATFPIVIEYPALAPILAPLVPIAIVLYPSELGDGTIPPGMMNEGEECEVPTTPPDGLVENPHRPGSWGEIGPDGKFKEKWRRDEGRPNIKSGHGSQDHIHVGDRWYPIKKK
jgi:hypothetical protein